MASATELMLLVKGDSRSADAALDSTSAKLGGLGKVLAGAGIGAAAGKAAEAVAGIGTAFDDAYDGIVIKTGATGAQLEGLQQAFRGVVSTVPVDFETASAAVGVLGQRLDIVGDVEALGVQLSNLSRITGIDVTTATQGAVDLFAAFGIKADEQSGALDRLFVASQQSGAGFDELQSALLANAPVLKSVGLSFEDATGIMAELTANGLDAAKILPGIGAGAMRAAKDGKDLPTWLAETQEAILNAGSEAEANKVAVEAFGKKGIAMGQALRSGAMDVGMLVTGLDSAGGAINSTATGTDDLQQKLDLLKNKVMLAAEGFAPLGMTIAPFASMMPMLGGALGGVVPLLGGLATTITTSVIPAVVALAAPFLPVILAVGAVVAVVGLLTLAWDRDLGGIQEKAAALRESLSDAFSRLREAVASVVDSVKQKVAEVKDWIVTHKDQIVNALLLLTGPVGALAVVWREKGDEIRATLADLASRIQGWVDDVRASFEDMRASIQEKVDAARAFLEQTWATIQAYVAEKIESIRVGISEGWTRIKEFLQTTLSDMLDGLRKAWTDMLNAVQSALDGIQSVVDTVLSWMERTFGLKLDLVKQIVAAAFDFMRNSIAEAIYLVQGIIDGLLSFLQGDFQGGVQTVIDTVVGFFRGMAENARLALDSLRSAVEAGIRTVVAAFQPIIDKVQELTGIDLYKVGRDLLDGLQRGIRSAFAAVEGAITALAGLLPQWIKDALGMRSPSLVFRRIGADVVAGLALGIVEEIPRVEDAMARAAGAVLAGYRQVAGSFGMGPGLQRAYGAFGTGSKLEAGVAGTAGVGYRSLLEHIRSASFGAIQGNQLADWMRRMGFDEETIEDYRDLHRMREGGRWKTREAAWLHRRRTVLTGGWTGGGGLERQVSRDWMPYMSEGAGPTRPGLLSGASGPVDVSLKGGRIEGDLRVREPIVVRLVIGPREIDAISTEVLRRLSGSLIAKPVVGTP